MVVQTSRRQFFGILGAALAGATLDPERLLWVPGRKTIFLPSADSGSVITLGSGQFQVGDIISIQGTYLVNPATSYRITGIAASGLVVDLMPLISAPTSEPRRKQSWRPPVKRERWGRA